MKKVLTMRQVIEDGNIDLDKPLNFATVTYGSKDNDESFSSLVQTQGMGMIEFMSAYMQSFFGHIEDIADESFQKAVLAAVHNKAQKLLMEKTSMQDILDIVKNQGEDIDDDDDNGGGMVS